MYMADLSRVIDSLIYPQISKGVPFIYPEIAEGVQNLFTNVLLIDRQVPDYQQFVDSVNSSTFPIVYSTMSSKTELLSLLQKMFTSISRIGIAFTSELGYVKIFLDCNPLFKEEEEETVPFSENVQFIIDVIKEFSVTNIDYLACNTLNYTNWTNYYQFLTLNTGVVVGASNDKTGNIKYGGDWTMESTGQDVELIYFTQNIQYYTYLLDYQVSYLASRILGTTGTYPGGITIDASGNVYTANSMSNNVSKITPAGVSTIFCTIPFNNPGWTPDSRDITIDSAGNLYIANAGNNDVSKVTPAGIISTFATTGENPVEITIDSAGNIYTANYNGMSVSKITPAGVSSTFSTPNTNPRSIVVDSAGNMYVADDVKHIISKITPAGVYSIFVTLFPTNRLTTGAGPGSLAIDSAGNLYTPSYKYGSIYKITPDGVISIFCSTPHVFPVGIKMDSQENLYTTVYDANDESYNINYIVKITPAGVATIIGTVFQASSYMAIDSAGSVYLTSYLDDVRVLQIIITCFKKDTKILTDKGYIPIQDLSKGDFVKTSLHDYKAINIICKSVIYHRASEERIKNQLYKCSKDNFDEIFEPLIITGSHSILVDDFTSKEQREKTNKVLGDIFITDDKYRLPACADERTSVYEIPGYYTVYHMALENDDYYENYGIFANGLLVESCSKRYLKELSNMDLIE